MAKKKREERPETGIALHDVGITPTMILQRRLFRHMLALRIKELDTAATLAKSLMVELSAEFCGLADALASTVADAYEVDDEVIDDYLKQLGGLV